VEPAVPSRPSHWRTEGNDFGCKRAHRCRSRSGTCGVTVQSWASGCARSARQRLRSARRSSTPGRRIPRNRRSPDRFDGFQWTRTSTAGRRSRSLTPAAGRASTGSTREWHSLTIPTDSCAECSIRKCRSSAPFCLAYWGRIV